MADTINPTGQPTRRFFLTATLAASGGLMLGLSSEAKPVAGKVALGDYITINPDNTVTLLAKIPEIGQGIKTTLAMLIAEELDVDWAQVKVEMAPADAKRFGDQFAGGSVSTPTNWDPMRKVGAAARQMILAAGADALKVPVGQLTTAKGYVLHQASGRKLSYGALARAAAAKPVPDLTKLTLKDAKAYTIVGKSRGGVDSARVLSGEPIFGIDMTLPGMVYAVYVKAPVYGAKLKSADLTAVKAMPGVKDVFALDGSDDMHGLRPGVAIVAKSWWYAKAARDALNPVWDGAFAADHDSEVYASTAVKLLAAKGKTEKNNGDVDAAIIKAAKTLEASYEVPFIPHVPMEPQNCTAQPTKDGGVEIWAPSQTPNDGGDLVAKGLGIPRERVVVHMRRAGGGFGRRLENDYMIEAAAIAQKVGKPVKLVWTREDDIAYDFYRPGTFHALKAGLSEDGKVAAYSAHGVTYTHDGKVAQGGEIDGSNFSEIVVPNYRFETSSIGTIIPTGYLRAPISNGQAFVHESFWDELAHAAGKDPVVFRLTHLAPHQGDPLPKSGWDYNAARMKAVLEIVAERSGWGKTKLEAGEGMGVATYFSHQGHFAEVAKVKVDADGEWRVLKVWAVGDVGSTIINPSGAANQVEGAILDGIGEMRQELHFDKGQVRESNFTDIPMMRMSKAPDVDVHFHITDFAPTGLGEPALPPILPAVANAIFAATGARVRSLPMTAEKIQAARKA